MSQCQDVYLAQHGLVHLATEMATVISPLQTGVLLTLNTYCNTPPQMPHSPLSLPQQVLSPLSFNLSLTHPGMQTQVPQLI